MKHNQKLYNPEEQVAYKIKYVLFYTFLFSAMLYPLYIFAEHYY